AQRNVQQLASSLRDAQRAAAQMASPEANRRVKELGTAYAKAQRDVSRAAASYDRMASSAKAARDAFSGGAAITSIGSHERALRAKLPDVILSQVLDQICSQVAVTGDFHHAMEAIEDNVQLRMVAQAKRPGEDVSHGFELLNKALELAGVTSNPEKHHRYMNH